MSEITYKFKFDSLIKDGRVDVQIFEQIKEWSCQNEDIPKLTDEQIALFVLACKNHLENTKKCISAYYKIKLNGPELFNERDPERDDIQKQIKILQFCIMPVRTKDNCAVILHRLQDSTPSNYNMDVAMKVMFMTLDATLHENPPNGLVILFDMRHVGLMHLSRVKLGCLRIFFSYLQEALPIKLREIHVFNTVWFFDKVMAIIKPFMNKDLIYKLNLHTSGINMEEFYEKWVPKYALPSDFGGDLPTSEIIHEETHRKLLSLQSHFRQEEKQRQALYNKNNNE